MRRSNKLGKIKNRFTRILDDFVSILQSYRNCKFIFKYRQYFRFVFFFRTVAVDLRGYGSSEKSSDLTSYKLKTLTKNLKDLIGVLSR